MVLVLGSRCPVAGHLTGQQMIEVSHTVRPSRAARDARPKGMTPPM
jgi:hypothetical protein